MFQYCAHVVFTVNLCLFDGILDKQWICNEFPTLWSASSGMNVYMCDCVCVRACQKMTVTMSNGKISDRTNYVYSFYNCNIRCVFIL